MHRDAIILGVERDITQLHGLLANHTQVNSAQPRIVSAALPVLTSQTGQVAAVVMEITAGPASVRGVVSMEIPPRGALAAVEEDEDREQSGSEERLQHLGQLRRRGPTSRQGNFYMLIVIGEIATEHQLHTARQHIERGEPLTESMPHLTH